MEAHTMTDLFDRIQDLADRAEKHREKIEKAEAKLHAEVERIETELLFADTLSLLNEIRTHRLGDTNRQRVQALRERIKRRIAA